MLERRQGARAFGGYLVFHVALGSAAMGGGREWRVGERRDPGRIGVDERLLAGVPGFEHLLVGPTADQARGKVTGQKAAAILFGKEAVEAPRALREDADVENVDNHEIAGLGAVDAD